VAKQTTQPGKKVIVIGASMAGLLAARALADHFEQVTLLERDIFPPPGENRKGVPQGRHTHVLLERGRRIMEEYLPGLTADLAGLGAVNIADVSLSVRWFRSGAYHRPGASGISGIGVARPTLEAAFRQHVLALPNVHAREDCNVTGLLTTPDKGRVTGVRLVDRRAGTGEESLLADLVVDASGRGSRSPAWLEKLGYSRPAEDEVRVGLGYTTCYYRRRPEHLSGLKGVVQLPTPPNKRMGVIMAQDGDRWVVTLGGYLGDHAPTNYTGFLEFARSLATPDIYNLIKGAELLSEPVAHKFPANLRHRYDKLARFPDGYLVFGDALCSFNPIYGQGMTVAALEAVALGECLAQGHAHLARRFFAEAGPIIDLAWSTTVGNDLSNPEVEGQRTPMVRFLNWYIDKLHKAAHTDAVLSIAFQKVINMVAPPPTILNPAIAWRVMKGNLRLGQREPAAGKGLLESNLTETHT
jgi:2-polyprenyl-6-methoxyphenol hydroxylase-like FAD-dependent oxidoreductase